MLHGDLTGIPLAGINEDIQWFLTTVPGHIAELRTIVEKGVGYLPQIKTIVVKAGAQLPKVADIVTKSIAYLPTIQAIVEDPALPTLVNRVQKLRSLETAARTEAASAKKPQPGPPGPVGVGLHRFVGPLDTYISFREHPAKFYAILGVGLVAVVGGSFMAGRWTKRCQR